MKRYVWLVIAGILIPLAYSLFHSLNAKRTGQTVNAEFLKDMQDWSKGRKCNAGLSYEQAPFCGTDDDCHFVTRACAMDAIEGLDRVCKKSKEVEARVSERLRKFHLRFVSKRIENLIVENVPNEGVYRMIEPLLSKGSGTVKLEGSTLFLSGWVEKKPQFRKAHCKSPKEIQEYLETELALQ